VRVLPLTSETQAILARIRTFGSTLSVYGMSPSEAWRLVRARVDRRIMDAEVSILNINAYRRYVHELVKAFRTQTGEPLARAVEHVIRKWTSMGLKSELLQGLLLDCFRHFERQGYAKQTAIAPTGGKKRGPKARRLPRRSYEKAIKKGRASRARFGTIEEQAARQRTGSARAIEIAAGLRPLLAARQVPGTRFVAYFAFAQKLGRLSRKYADKSLRMAAADLVDLYEAKSLDGDTLRAIAAVLFGINVTS
jgi:hypothetical protein